MEARCRLAGTAVVIDLIGDVTERDQPTLQRAYEQAIEDSPDRIFFNFGDTEYINTSGIAVLVSMVMAAEKAGRTIGFFGMTPHYRKVFTLVRLPLYAELYDDERQALASS
jgi:anti-anti-sigma factor